MIEIGKVIYYLLSGNTTIHTLVADKIYPLILPENTILPAVVYERRSDNEYNKDSYTSNVSLEITILSNSYSNSIDITTAINNVLESYQGTNLGIRFKDTLLTGVDETYVEGAYIQKLTYNIIL